MEPIINPLWFYLIDVAGGLNTMSGSIVVFGTGICIIYFISILFKASYDNIEESDKMQYSKNFKTIFKIIIPCVILTILAPSSDTIYKMIIANNITPHNIEIVGDTVESSIDYIFEKINTIYISEKLGSDE